MSDVFVTQTPFIKLIPPPKHAARRKGGFGSAK